MSDLTHHDCAVTGCCTLIQSELLNTSCQLQLDDCLDNCDVSDHWSWVKKLQLLIAVGLCFSGVMRHSQQSIKIIQV